jgi:hypothetical protein
LLWAGQAGLHSQLIVTYGWLVQDVLSWTGSSRLRVALHHTAGQGSHI